jgi:DNA-binding NarL/FixJ family response regulator
VTDTHSTSPLRVLVVDPDERVRDSLAGLLCIGERCVVVGTAADAVHALELVAPGHPDVIVVDARMAEAEGGSDFIARLRSADGAPRVVVMGATEAEVSAVVSGADGYIRKTFRARELVDAVVAASRPRLS